MARIYALYQTDNDLLFKILLTMNAHDRRLKDKRGTPLEELEEQDSPCQMQISVTNYMMSFFITEYILLEHRGARRKTTANGTHHTESASDRWV